MRIILLIAILSNAGIASALACPWVETFVSPSSKSLSPAKFRGISCAMSVPSIIDRLGPAARDVGSGLHVLQWDVTDGRTFFVSTGSACGKPVSIGFHQAGPDDSSEELPSTPGE